MFFYSHQKVGDAVVPWSLCGKSAPACRWVGRDSHGFQVIQQEAEVEGPAISFNVLPLALGPLSSDDALGGRAGESEAQ